jgi:ribosomal subunit interface protein
MKIHIRSNVPLSDAITEHIDRKLDLALRHVPERVTRVTVHIADENGPKGGLDKRCRIVVGLGGLDPIVVQDRGDDVYAVVSRAAAKVDEQVSRVTAWEHRRRARDHRRAAERLLSEPPEPTAAETALRA